VKADFYVGTMLELEWIGSVTRNGNIYKIPVDILIQINQTMYEEKVFDFIRKQQGFVLHWPHFWHTSELTDFSYIFDSNLCKVFMYMRGSDAIYDPVKIVQGEDLQKSFYSAEKPHFPLMNIIDFRRRKYGRKAS